LLLQKSTHTKEGKTVRRALYSILLAGLFVLMLSSLVVTPESADVQPPIRLPAEMDAVFRPLVSAMLPETAETPSNGSEVRMILSALPLLWACAVPLAAARDANGRILRSVRYENSVYQLFRPEVDGG